MSPAALADRIAASARTIAALAQQADAIHALAAAVRDRLAAGGRVYTCGNGGSAAEALHLAEELIGKYRNPRAPYPAVCLNADPTALTCIANDFGYDHVFARQVKALATNSDVLVAFSTSGASANIKLALEAAREQKALTIALLGKDGGPCALLADHPLIVRDTDTARIQEAHQVILHLILETVESR